MSSLLTLKTSRPLTLIPKSGRAAQYPREPLRHFDTVALLVFRMLGVLLAEACGDNRKGRGNFSVIGVKP